MIYSMVYRSIKIKKRITTTWPTKFRIAPKKDMVDRSVKIKRVEDLNWKRFNAQLKAGQISLMVVDCAGSLAAKIVWGGCYILRGDSASS